VKNVIYLWPLFCCFLVVDVMTALACLTRQSSRQSATSKKSIAKAVVAVPRIDCSA